MVRPQFLPILLSVLFFTIVVGFSEIPSYAKVSKNGQESTDVSSRRPLSWIARALMRNTSTNDESEGRSIKNIAITVSPVYVPQRTPKLKLGEAIDYPSTTRYSTLDREMVAKLDAAKNKQQIQQRFHPPASFEHVIAHSNGMKQQNGGFSSGPGKPPDSGPPNFSGPPFSGTFDYKPPDFLEDKPISKPLGIDEYTSDNDDSKPPDTYASLDSPQDQEDFPDFANGPTYTDPGPKPIHFSEHYNRPHVSGNNFKDDPTPYDQDHDHPGYEEDQEVIYDHPPDYHQHHYHHYHDEHTTMPPEMMNDQRLDKRPYSYYFIGKKLWYIPLYFSIYFIVYIAALVLKSIARHKINFPAHLAEVAGHARGDSNEPTWWNLGGRVLEGVENFARRFGDDC